MGDVIHKTINEIDYYKGPNSVPGIKFHSAAKDLGVTAWGMGLLEIAAGCDAYPEHDHLKDGQEEVYVVLKGSGTLHAGAEKLALSEGSFVRVGPGSKRKILPGPSGITVLAIGSTPGKAYTPRT